MTAVRTPPRKVADALHSDAPVGPAGAMDLPAEVVPEHLLDGGELVLFAIKPSLWFILLVSARWIAAMALLAAAARLMPDSGVTLPLMQLAVGLAIARLAWATMQWSTRLYVLTNRRVMRIRGIFNVQVFECPLTRIQNTHVTLSLAERLLRVGSVHVSTAAGAAAGGSATWRIVARPLEVHERLREAIRRAQKGHPHEP